MEILVGRAGNQSLIINDGSVDKIHCKLIVFDSGLVAVANISRKGTLVNGVPVMRQTIVKPDDELRLGDSFTVRVKELLVQENYAAYTSYLYVARKYTSQAELEAFIHAAACKSASEMPDYVMPVVNSTLAYYYIQGGQLYQAQMLLYDAGDQLYDLQDGSEILQGVYASLLGLVGWLYLEAGRYAEARTCAEGALQIFNRLPAGTLSTTPEQLAEVEKLDGRLKQILD